MSAESTNELWMRVSLMGCSRKPLLFMKMTILVWILPVRVSVLTFKVSHIHSITTGLYAYLFYNKKRLQFTRYLCVESIMGIFTVTAVV